MMLWIVFAISWIYIMLAKVAPKWEINGGCTSKIFVHKPNYQNKLTDNDYINQWINIVTAHVKSIPRALHPNFPKSLLQFLIPFTKIFTKWRETFIIVLYADVWITSPLVQVFGKMRTPWRSNFLTFLLPLWHLLVVKIRGNITNTD